VRAVAERFIELDAKPTVETWRRMERTLEMHVLPAIGDKRIKDIGKADLHDLLDGIVEGTGPGAAKGALQNIHRLFEFALDRELVTRNPAPKLKRADLKANADVGRALDDDELKAIWKAAGEIGYPFGSYIKMLILTGQRRNDWAKAQYREIDVGERSLTIAAARYKGRREHIVPLVGEAWDIVERLPRWASGDYLFSNRDGKGAINSFARGKARLDKIAGMVVPYTLHDFRRTAETRMAALHIPQEHRDAVIGHMRSGLQKTYNKFDYAAERRSALTKYATHLMGIVGE
jgi:integrase